MFENMFAREAEFFVGTGHTAEGVFFSDFLEVNFGPISMNLPEYSPKPLLGQLIEFQLNIFAVELRFALRRPLSQKFGFR